MPDLITQDELDTLFTAIEVADRHRRPGASPATAALYDFRHATKLSPDHLRVLQGRVTVLAAVLDHTVSLYLNNTAEFRAPSVDVLSYEQYMRNLSDKAVLGVVGFAGGVTPALWELSPAPAYAALDCMLGGAGELSEPPDAEATAVQRAVLRRLFQEILSAWTELWDRLRDLAPVVYEVVSSPGAIDLRATDERLFCVGLEVNIAQTTGLLRLCLPLMAVKRLLREEKDTISPTDLDAAVPELPAGETLAETPVPITAYLEPPPFTLRTLLSLSPGQTLDLRHPAGQPFEVAIGGVPKFQGEPGMASGKVAIRLLSSTPPDL
ncbi:MAG: FliM/FliN family flagellar motor switch protein [Armatimonadia bacterium]